MTSDLSATALRDTVARVRATLGDCDNHADLVCSSGDHHVDVDDLHTLLTALARLQEERDRAEQEAEAWMKADGEVREQLANARAEVSRLTTALQQAGNVTENEPDDVTTFGAHNGRATLSEEGLEAAECEFFWGMSADADDERNFRPHMGRTIAAYLVAARARDGGTA